jgi:radical SAM superfamily enzyme YgiQ (UPF0313 family)
MKVLLLWPNSRNEILGWGDLGAVAEPLALEYLAAGVRLDGHEVCVLDLRLHPDQLDAQVRQFGPDVVGVTAFSMHVLTALRLLRQVKEIAPTCRTVAGGHHATLLPEDFFAPEVDFVVCGEGVAPLRRLLARLTAGADGHGIPGVWARHHAHFVSGGAPESFDPDALPPPDRTVAPSDRPRYFIDWMRPVALVRTSVGCPYRCTFCSLWKIMDGKYRMRAIEPVVEEIATVGEPWVFLVDDEAFIHGPRMHALADALRAAGVRKRFFTYCRMDSLLRNREVLAAWREVGLERLFVGIDGISSAELTAYNKRLRVAQIEAGLAAAETLGIEIFAQFVVNPGYSRRDFQRLARFVEHHQIRYPSFTVLTPIPGTDLLRTFDHVTEKQPNGRPNWDLFDCQNAVTATALPPDEFRREYRNLYRLFKGAYTQYRPHNYVVDPTAHDGEVAALADDFRARGVSRVAM